MMKKRVGILLFLIMLFIPASSHAFWWMIYHKPSFHGRVIDAETKEPIEGAVVVVEYVKNTAGFPEHYTSIIEIKETLTDKNGEFYIPSYTTIIQPLSAEFYAGFIIYKPGYGKYPGRQVSPPTQGIDPEEFFSKEKTGTKGEMEWEVTKKKFNVTFGVVELPRLKTREERRMAMPSRRGDSASDYKKQRQLIRLLNEERKNLGFEEMKIEEDK